jgi:hypothetical protein
MSDEGSETDGCELDFTEDPDDELTTAMRPLFPGDTSTTKGQWEELFPTGPSDGGSDAT